MGMRGKKKMPNFIGKGRVTKKCWMVKRLGGGGKPKFNVGYNSVTVRRSEVGSLGIKTRRGTRRSRQDRGVQKEKVGV